MFYFLDYSFHFKYFLRLPKDPRNRQNNIQSHIPTIAQLYRSFVSSLKRLQSTQFEPVSQILFNLIYQKVLFAFCNPVAIQTLMFDLPQSTTPFLQFSPTIDLQYEICSQLMKKSSDQLLQKELELMQKTSSFFQKIGDSIYTKDISTTQESFTLDTLLDQEDSFLQPSKSRLLLRKSQSNCTLRRSESGISDAMQEVRRRCSQKTVALLSGAIGEVKRSRQKILSHDRLQKELKRMQNKFQIKEEQLLILRKKLKDMQEANKLIQHEMGAVKSKLKEAKNQMHSDLLRGSRASESSLRIEGSPHHEKMRKFLQDKEMHIIRKEKDLKSIQHRIQSCIEEPFEEGCDKCCQLVKKIKDSVMRYRKFLEEEANMAETLYLTYKKSFS